MNELSSEETTATPAPDPPDYSSVASNSFQHILKALGISLAVTTYQAGKLILVRADEDALNTQFCGFPSPMGIAYKEGFLALGDRCSVWKFRNMAEMVVQPGDRRKNDAIFLPASRIFTGDIRIHEIEWAGEELVAVNTRFSCLSTFDGHHNFIPHWRPDFISSYSAEDRCHLNGLCVADDRPAVVSCHAMTDGAAAWRNQKVDGGALIDVATGRVIARGLAMPHSPRLYQNRLWFLESGYGRLSSMDLISGTIRVESEFPGFTRGLDFLGRYAFVGLSQVRETATFSGVPISEPDLARKCGVWIFDIVEKNTVGFLEFSGSVQEIFSIRVLPFTWPDVVLDREEWLENSFFVPPELVHEFTPAPGQDHPSEENSSAAT